MGVLESLHKATEERQGNRPRYEEAHVVLTMLFLEESGPMGRMSLMKRNGLTEGTIKTMLRRLREEGIVEVDRVGGVSLTTKGRELVGKWRERFSLFEVKLPSISWEGMGLRVREGKGIVERLGATNLRDLAVKAGSNGALVSVFYRDRIELPPFTTSEVEVLLREIRGSCPACTEGDLFLVTIPKDTLIPIRLSLKILETWTT